MARARRNPHNGGQQLPLIVPISTWRPPATLPDLRNEKYIALDRETKDPGLRTMGAGWAYGSGHIMGTSIAWAGGAFYAPLRHPETENIDIDAWTRWERDHINAGCRFVFQNAPYDLGFGRSDLGLPCPQHIEDTTAMAVLVDENRASYELDDLAAWRGISGKDEALLDEAASIYGDGGNAKANIWRIPARYVGPYAEQDAVATLAIFHSLLPEIEAQGLTDAYRLEMDLVPMVQEMRWRGIRVNLDRAEQIRAEQIALRDRVLETLSDQLGSRVGMDEMRSSARLAVYFDQHKIAYPRTPKSNAGAFEKDWMEDHPHWLPQAVVAARTADDGANKFIGEYILNYAHRGRIHAGINQWRSKDGGTRSHRFSYSNPPVQQFHDMVRGAFEPEPGELWMKADFSQQEVRLIVHFAKLLNCDKADEAAQRFINDPDTDYHVMVSEITGLPRKDAKAVTFAKAYGAGVKKFALMNGCSEDEAKSRIGQYDQEMPFVKQLNERCQRAADQRGYIKLIDGARCHFDLWEAARWDDNRDADGKYLPPRPLEQARETWPEGRLRRAFTHKAMNRLIQGSGARQVKKAMRECWREGIVPMIQLHDDLSFSFSEEARGNRVAEIMRDCHKFSLPFKVDTTWGLNWGHASKIKGGYGATFDAAKALLQLSSGL